MVDLNKKPKAKPVESTKLKCDIVESILMICLNHSNFNDILMQIPNPLLSFRTLKKYLFYLIECEFVSYNGQRRTYKTEEKGFYLLDEISIEKKTVKIHSKDLIISLDV